MRMDRRCVLFPVDIDESTPVLLSAVRQIRDIGVGEVRLLHVVHPVDALAVPDIVTTRTEILSTYRSVLLESGIPVVRGEVVIGTPWIEITERARSREISFVLMGSQGKGLLQRMFLGSQTENVLYHTDKTICILRIRADEGRFQLTADSLFADVLFATDLSEGSKRGIPYLEQMARVCVRLTVAYVEDIRHFEYASPDVLHAMRARVQKDLQALKKGFLEAGFENVEIVCRRGNAIRELLELIEERRPSLLVLGAKGSYDIAERVLGGVAETLVHRAPVHILLCRN